MDKPAEPEGIQIKLRPVDHGANETDTGDAPMAGSPAAGGMKRGTPPPPPGALALTYVHPQPSYWFSSLPFV